MSFLVTARKYRPSTFTEVVAQGHVVNTLLNSIKLERIAHAYLFSGPRGVGKTTTARIFAKALNCPNAKDGEPCNTCDTCVEISQGRCIDVIEIDGASNNGVEQVRTIRDAVRYTPSRDKYKMYIIDEVHMLTKGAFNALLKTLEEPPAHALFIFATTEPHKMPPTVISRCQRYDFRRIATEDIVGQLRSICSAENIDAEENALFAIARKGDGSMRDAESIFDQVVAFSGSSLRYDDVRQVLHIVDQDTFFSLTNLIITKNTREGFALAEDVVMSGYDIQDFLAGLEEHLRNLLVVRSTGDTRLIEAPEDIRDRYRSDAEQFTEGDLLRLLKLNAQTMQAIKFSPQPRLKFEIALIDMIKMDSTVEISTLLAQIEQGGVSLPHGGGTASGNSPTGNSSQGHSTVKSNASVKGSAAARPSAAAAAPPTTASPPAAENRPHRESNATEPLRQAEERFRQALNSASLSAAGSHKATVPGEAEPAQGEQPSSSPENPPHPIVQMLINNLDAELLPRH